jgi:hypothetical protein
MPNSPRQNRTPDFRLQKSHSTRSTIGAIIASFAFLLPESLPSETDFNFFASHEQVRPVRLDWHCHLLRADQQLLFCTRVLRRFNIRPKGLHGFTLVLHLKARICLINCVRPCHGSDGRRPLTAEARVRVQVSHLGGTEEGQEITG